MTQAKDVMTTNVVTVRPDTTVMEIARTLLDRHISAVPVLDDNGRLVGIVSEGDLMRRPETGTDRRSSWWLAFLTLGADDNRRFVKTHGRHARDVMTRDVLTIDEESTLENVADILESRHIKRLPVTRNGQLVGIVSRADLLRGLASAKIEAAPSVDDRVLREKVEAAIRQKAGFDAAFVGLTVSNGVVGLWGGAMTQAAKDAARVAAENVAGVRKVEDKIAVYPPDVRTAMWAE
jgi:CBS domain-containing protein